MEARFVPSDPGQVYKVQSAMKNYSARLFATLLSLVMCTCGGGGTNQGPPPPPPGSINVTTWHYDNLRTGANTAEALLTLTNVNPNTFGKLFSLSTDGEIIGQALYLSNVAIPGKGTHNVIYVATMHDSVYAYDADDNLGANADPLWKTNLLPLGATPVPMSVQGCQGITGWSEVGVVATPVIDRPSGTLYVVAKTYESGSTVFRLHALDVKSGQEKVGAPVKLAATYSANGFTDTFNPLAETNRPALLLANSHIYLAFGSNGCNAYGVQGWVLSYNASSLALEGAFNTEPGKALASIWQKGAGLSADSAGNIYAESGEGTFTPGSNFGSSVLKLRQAGSSLQLADWFTPYNQAYLSANDLDLNAPVLVLPDQPGAHPHLAVGVGKEGTLYLLDRDNLGKFCFTCTTSDTQIVQELPLAVAKKPGALLYWNSTIYATATGGPITAWPITNGLLAGTPALQTANQVGGHSPVVTSNGKKDGILWQINGSSLTAYDATTLVRLYNSADTNGRDTLPSLPHFSHFIVANGKVYVSTNSGVVVMGLL